MPPAPKFLYLRNGTYWGRVKIGGREHRRSLLTTDPREAARRVKAWRLKLQRSELGAEDAPTFKAAVVRWVEEVLPNSVKPAVAKRYLVSIRQLDQTFGNLSMPQITTQAIGEYISARANLASNATIRRDLTALSRLLASCVAWGWRQDNPARWYDRSIIRERRDPITPPSPEDVATVLAAAPEGIRPILALLSQTGMRENEAVTLDLRNLAGGTITITQTKTGRPRTLAWHTPGGDAGPLLLPLMARKGLLFPAPSGGHYKNFASNAAQLMRRVERQEKTAKRPFRRFRVHDLRHAFAIRWLTNGGDIYALSRHLGHTSVKTTEIYLGYVVAQIGAQINKKPSTQTPD